MGSAQTPPALVRFGVFEADLRAGELKRNGVRVRLQDLPFRALTLLLSRPGEVIAREEFRQALWPPDIFVDFEQGISSAVMRLRDALGDSADNPIFIETIERRGYRWIGPVNLPQPVSQELREKDSQEKVSREKDSPEKELREQKLREQELQENDRQGKDSQEKELREGTYPEPPTNRATAPWSSRSPRLWKMVFALTILALLFAVWIFRLGYRDAKAGMKSTPSRPQSLHQSANREAEDFYLKGRFYLNKRTPESLNQAVDAFTQAIAHDPNYSDAYVGLADSYNLLREFSAMPANEAYFKAFAAAKKAVELAPQSSEAHASLAFVTFFGMWDAADAEKEFRHALELDPNSAKAHHWYATFLHALNRHDEALSEIELARKLSPDSPAILADKGDLLWSGGQHDEALQLLKQLEAADPDFLSPHRYLRYAYLETADYPNYILELKKDAQLTHDTAQVAVAEAAEKGFAQGGERGLFQAELSEQKKLYAEGKLSPYWLAQNEARLGDRSEAFKHLARCVQSHDDLLLNLSGDQGFASLHGDPGFQQLFAKIGLPAPR
jgi:DNA-binding winged helix-turn-helix (wHTH) protein/Tfp pilus assembly protein PilF